MNFGILLKIPIRGKLRYDTPDPPVWDALPSKLGLFVDTQYEMDPSFFSSMDYWHFRAGLRLAPRWYGFAQATVVTNTMRGVIAAGVKPGDPTGVG